MPKDDKPQRAKTRRVVTCRWKACRRPQVENSLFCESHVQPPATADLPKWIKDLPYVIGTGLATNILYDMLREFAKVLFHDSMAEKVSGMQYRLKMEALADVAIEEVAEFVALHQHDPGFSKDLGKALRRSAVHDVGVTE